MSRRAQEQLAGALQLFVIALVVVTAFAASHIWPWNSPGFRPMRAFALIALAAAALLYVLATRARLRLLPGSLILGAFTFVAVLSTLWSPMPRLTLERALAFAVLAVGAVAVGLGVVGRPRAAGHVLLALLAAGVLIALFGLVELWRSYEHAVLPASKGQGARYNGIGQNPNQMAMLMALTLPLCLWAVRQTTDRKRALAAGAALLVGGSLVASGSRGAVIAAFVGCAAYLLAVSRRRLLVASVATAVFLAGIGITQLPQPAAENPAAYPEFGRTTKLSPRDINSELPLESEFGFPGENVETGATRTLFFSSGRGEAWELGVRQALDRPLAGYGFGTEDETFVDRSYIFVSRTVENSFVSVFLQLGAVGVALLVAVLVLPLLAWRRARRAAADSETAENAAVCGGIVCAGIVLAVPQSFLTSVGSPPTAPFWIAIMLLAALAAGVSPRRAQPRGAGA